MAIEGRCSYHSWCGPCGSQTEEEVTGRLRAMVGYPVMLKASNGGGGRGMRIVNCAEDMPVAYREACRRIQESFR